MVIVFIGVDCMRKNVKGFTLTRDEFIKHIQNLIYEIQSDYIDLNAGLIHRELGGYPGNNHRIPVCCDAMKSLMLNNDFITNQPIKGNGASLTIRYHKRIEKK